MIGAYLRERFPLRVFVPAIGGLALAAWSTARHPDARTLLCAALMTSVLVVQFRVWDDLEDRARDRVRYPTRVLSRSPVGPFQVFTVALAAFALGLSWTEPWACGALLSLDVAAALAYRFLRPRLMEATWRFGVLPLKYPAFIVVTATGLGGASGPRLTRLALAAYLAACVHEAWHDRPSNAGIPL